MSDYRRSYERGGCYFFTVVTHDRRPWLTQPDIYERLREGFRHVATARPFHVDGIVVLPDHLHCIWRLPETDSDFSTRWRLIKHFVSRGANTILSDRSEKFVWQRRFWEHQIRDERDWRRHLDYIFFNPVKHGYVSRPADWKFSSFEHAVAKGWYGFVGRNRAGIDLWVGFGVMILFQLVDPLCLIHPTADVRNERTNCVMLTRQRINWRKEI